MEYIFNDCVIFKETEGLRYKQQVQATVPMSALQAGVLIELIKAQGEPVRRDDLLDHVWEANGYPASNHSLNHNIGFLRNALKKIGIDEAIITVHRVGFKLSNEVDVQIWQPESALLSEGDNNNASDNYLSNEGGVPQQQIKPLNKRWWCLRQIMQKKKLSCFIYALVPMLLILVAAAGYFLRPAAETRYYVATVMGCKTYSVNQLANSQLDKYRRYAGYFLQSQEKSCASDDILLMYVQDEHGFSETLEGNKRAFFAICNFEPKKSDFCNSFYAYSMEPQ